MSNKTKPESKATQKSLPGHLFKPGQSGNPGGMSKVAMEAKRLAQGYAIEAIEKLAYWMRCDDPKASIEACKVILDRGLGKPKEIEVEDAISDLTGMSEEQLRKLAMGEN